MHAFLLVEQEITNFQLSISNLASKLGAKVMEYPLVKIEDVRNLNNFLRLTITEPTLIYCPNIHETGVEALNAFLKNLEEPQENIYFALTAPSIRKVLPTIVSRCQVIQIRNTKHEILDKGTGEFMKKTLNEKIMETDKIKDRGVAIDFVSNLINNLHTFMHSNEVDYTSTVHNIEIMTTTLNNLKKNGNVNLQLTNMVVGLI
ncbi:MAG TPA: hypothetical protein VFI61_01130 [Patescibacteria group bacterium]|nr:hypothetical protein [Patescibacteria group bacterium]